jgi:hypothetical protein
MLTGPLSVGFTPGAGLPRAGAGSRRPVVEPGDSYRTVSIDGDFDISSRTGGSPFSQPPLSRTCRLSTPSRSSKSVAGRIEAGVFQSRQHGELAHPVGVEQTLLCTGTRPQAPSIYASSLNLIAGFNLITCWE